MPVALSAPELYPPLYPEYFLSFQFSSWYPTFSQVSIRSTIVRPLTNPFHEYLESDGVFVPKGSEDVPATSTLSDDEPEAESDSDDSESTQREFEFPELDAAIRRAVAEYGAVFPKLNFSSPKDASWVLPPSSPLKCTSPADVYLLLKSSDFITHDLNRDSVFDGCRAEDLDRPPEYSLELILRKWYMIDRSRELRCFVRQDRLIGISQRDTNYYEFYNEPSTRRTIIDNTVKFWETHIKGKWRSGGDYTFDILMTRDLSRAHVLDFNPYAPRTDPLLFSYDELLALLVDSTAGLPCLKVIDSRAHPAANRNAPVHQHNMVPFEALDLSSGRGIEEFADLWREEITRATTDD